MKSIFIIAIFAIVIANAKIRHELQEPSGIIRYPEDEEVYVKPGRFILRHRASSYAVWHMKMDPTDTLTIIIRDMNIPLKNNILVETAKSFKANWTVAFPSKSGKHKILTFETSGHQFVRISLRRRRGTFELQYHDRLCPIPEFERLSTGKCTSGFRGDSECSMSCSTPNFVSRDENMNTVKIICDPIWKLWRIGDFLVNDKQYCASRDEVLNSCQVDQCSFGLDRVLALYEENTDAEKQQFNIDVNSVDFSEFFGDTVPDFGQEEEVGSRTLNIALPGESSAATTDTEEKKPICQLFCRKNSTTQTFNEKCMDMSFPKLTKEMAGKMKLICLKCRYTTGICDKFQIII